MFTCKKAPLAAAAALVVVGLAGCFGGGGSDAPATTPTAGKMVDGPVKGALVVCESVAVNGKVDAGEATTTSNADGTYSFANCNSPVAGVGGVNVVTEGTEFPFKGVLKSPAGSAVMTPLTGLLVGSKLNKDQLAKMLGLDGTDLTKADPSDPKNVALLKMTLVVQQLIADMADAIMAGGTGLDLTAIYAQVAAALATALETAAANNLTLITSSGVNASVLSSFTSELNKVAQANGVNPDLIGSALATAAANAKALNATTDLASLLNVAKDKQAGTNFFTLTGNTVEFVQTPLTKVTSVTVADLAAKGVAVTSLNKFSIAVGVDGKPAVGSSAVALNLVEVNGSGRALTAMIDKVTFALDANKQLSLTVPADATVHVFGKKGDASHTEVSASFKMGANLGSNVVRVESNKLTLDYSGLVDRLLKDTTITQKDVTDYWQNIQGTFTVTAAISNLDLRKSDKTALASTKVDVKNVAGGLLGSVSGVGFTGNVTIKAAQ